MRKRPQKNDMKTLMIALSLVLFSAVACGAASAKGEKKTRGPVVPITYDPRMSLAPLVEKVGPAVVHVKTETKVKSGFNGPMGLFEFFYGHRGTQPRPQERTLQAAGSGFIIDSVGLVVTNHHVIDKADKIEVQLDDERTFEAELVGYDERTDLALLKLKGASKLPSVDFGDSDIMRVGDSVVAIGNPFGLDHTVTSGIVSAKERVIGAGPYDDFIQTDASINPGNSGGPLFNLRGEVIGINTIKYKAEGIGFSIPSSLARGVIDSLRAKGKVVRGWLGIVPQPVDKELAAVLGLGNNSGALVTHVETGSPADKGGIKARDVILKINGKKLESARQIYSAVANLVPGKTANFKIVRDGKNKTLKVKIAQRPDETTQNNTVTSSETKKPKFGFDIEELTHRLRKTLGAGEVEGGVVVSSVSPGSKAESVLRRGDIIVEVNRKRVKDISHFNQLSAELKKGDDMLLLIFRRGAWIYKVIRL